MRHPLTPTLIDVEKYRSEHHLNAQNEPISLSPDEVKAADHPGEKAVMTPGNQTSEFSITKYVVLFGMFIDILGIVLEALKAFVPFGWLPVVLVVCGTLLTLLKALGYTRSRTTLKLAEVAPQVAPGLAELVPLIKALVQEAQGKQQAASLPGVLPMP